MAQITSNSMQCPSRLRGTSISDYDPAGRLWRVKDATDTVLSEYLYDANGNRIAGSFTAHSGAVLDADYDDQDRLAGYETTLGGAISFTYTANGELLSKTNTSTNTTTSYSYDALGNLHQVVLHEGEPNEQTIDYLIDGRNRRIGKKVGGNLTRQWLYDGQLKVVGELDSQGNILAQFVYASMHYAPDYMIKYGADAGTYRIVSDHLGSLRLVIDVATGDVVQRMDYDEFGNVLNDTNPGFQPLGFAGGLYDRDTKLVRFGKRDYDAETGRWTAKDVSHFAGGSANLYAYGNNNPVNYIDPQGRRVVAPWCVTCVSAVVTGATYGAIGGCAAGCADTCGGSFLDCFVQCFGSTRDVFANALNSESGRIAASVCGVTCLVDLSLETLERIAPEPPEPPDEPPPDGVMEPPAHPEVEDIPYREAA
jgi:RHS repeat-associated protein